MNKIMVAGLALLIGMNVYAAENTASGPTLKDIVQHFGKSGMPLDKVEYQKKLTEDQIRIGVVEGMNVEDDETKRKDITKVLYMFNVVRQKDSDSLAAQMQMAQSFKSEVYTNGLFMLTFGKNPPLRATIKSKIIKIFQSFGRSATQASEGHE